MPLELVPDGPLGLILLQLNIFYIGRLFRANKTMFARIDAHRAIVEAKQRRLVVYRNLRSSFIFSSSMKLYRYTANTTSEEHKQRVAMELKHIKRFGDAERTVLLERYVDPIRRDAQGCLATLRHLAMSDERFDKLMHKCIDAFSKDITRFVTDVPVGDGGYVGFAKRYVSYHDALLGQFFGTADRKKRAEMLGLTGAINFVRLSAQCGDTMQFIPSDDQRSWKRFFLTYSLHNFQILWIEESSLVTELKLLDQAGREARVREMLIESLSSRWVNMNSSISQKELERPWFT